MKIILTFAFCSIILLSGCQDQSGSELLDCWTEAYGADFTKELDALENQLVEHKMLEGRNMEDYERLLREINVQNMDKITVGRQFEEQPFLDCREKYNKPMNAYGQKTMKYGILFSIYRGASQ